MSCCVCSDSDNPELSKLAYGSEMYESLEQPEVHADVTYRGIQTSNGRG